MTAAIIEGRTLALTIQKNLKAEIDQQVQSGLQKPGLAVILVGSDPASKIYVSNKNQACLAVGFNAYSHQLDEAVDEKTLLNLIHKLNNDETIHGILVQLPLPKHINTRLIIESLHPDKDVDGFHPYNLGRLAQGEPSLRPCTPYGIIQLLSHYQIPLSGYNALVIGASNIVGKPMAFEFLLAKSTVTICHRGTRNLEQHVKAADIIVSATGVHDLIKTDWLQPHQVIIDVGIHRNAQGKIHGDVDFSAAKERVKAIAPVPGGVGPMTITTLLQNTLQASRNLQK